MIVSCTVVYSGVQCSGVQCAVEGKVVTGRRVGSSRVWPALGSTTTLSSEREREREQLCRHFTVCHQHQKYNDGCVVTY